MKSWQESCKNCLLVVLSIIAFYHGLKYGEKNSKLAAIAHCPGVEEDVQPINMQTLTHEEPDCNRHSVVPLTKMPQIKAESPTLECGSNLRKNLSVMHLGRATVPEDVFPFLHHPSSPAKWNYFLTQTRNWQSDTIEDSPCEDIYLTRTGSRQSQPNKCVAVTVVPHGSESLNQQSHRVGYTALNTDQYQSDYPREYAKEHNNENILLLPLLRDIERLKNSFVKLMGDPIDSVTGQRRRVIVMVANAGVMDLLLNFMCSAEAAKIDLSSVVVFVGDQHYMALVENMGAKAIYSPALGSMPAHAARGYLDDTFSRMMWFKTTSVYLALHAGFEVLFQDVDLVWLRDPFPYFADIEYDLMFMDDGARTPRYTPFFVNSGFYFVKYNDRTLYMFERMMKCGASEIGQTHSHQSVLIRHIAEAHHLYQLRVFVLDQTFFPSGQTYHERKNQVKRIQERSFRPFVFHMCWTDNRENKVVYFKDIGLWYVKGSTDDNYNNRNNQNTDLCSSGGNMLRYALLYQHDSTILDRCCARDRYWEPPPEYDAEQLKSELAVLKHTGNAKNGRKSIGSVQQKNSYNAKSNKKKPI